jgi:general secretion pathway protein A
MYLEFYGLAEKPFSTTPDPRFLFLTRRHRDALARLTYGVQEKKGFVVLTGEVGTGKTTLVRTLLTQIDPSIAAAFVFNSSLPFDGLLEHVLDEYGIADPGSTPSQRLLALSRFLIERSRAGLQTLLIVDEAQNLSVDSLEQIRLLSNFETASDKLVQIMLVGQPELEDTLALPALRQLDQRIELRVDIAPLSPAEMSDYITSRLRTAGATDVDIFVGSAPAVIAEDTDGIPRLINILCDHCLLIGYADQKRRINGEVVREAMESLHIRRRRPRRKAGARAAKRPRPRARRRIAMAVVAALFAGIALFVDLPDSLHLATLVRSMHDLLAR